MELYTWNTIVQKVQRVHPFSRIWESSDLLFLMACIRKQRTLFSSSRKNQCICTLVCCDKEFDLCFTSHFVTVACASGNHSAKSVNTTFFITEEKCNLFTHNCVVVLVISKDLTFHTPTGISKIRLLPMWVSTFWTFLSCWNSDINNNNWIMGGCIWQSKL